MNILLRFVPVTILLACTGPAAAQGSDRRVADLVRTGKVRIGLFSTQFSKDTGSGELRGVRPDMARAFAARVGVHAALLEYQGLPQVVECLKVGACDVVFLPKDARVETVGDFSFPYIQSEYTYLVPTGSTIRRSSDADGTGIRIAAVRTHASTATLSSVIKQAEADIEGVEFRRRI